jgi:hypothetical protein
MIHETLTNKRKLKKNAMPIYKISSFRYGSDFPLKIRYYYAFITKQMQKKTHFLNGISSKNLKVVNCPKFN